MAGLCDRTCASCDGPARPPPPCDDQRDGCSACIAIGFVFVCAGCRCKLQLLFDFSVDLKSVIGVCVFGSEH